MINSHVIFKGSWPMISVRLIIFTFISLLIMPGYLSAVEVQEKTNALVIGQAIKIDSKILNEERPLWVYLPEDYNSSKYKEYPVLYMLDGAYHFHHITGAVQVLAKRQRIPQMIVIGIPYIDWEHRERDLWPTSVNGRPPVAAADKFLAFIKEELIPFTEKNYRTDSYRILLGHSSAGLFSVYALIENPELFNTYLSISPSLYWDDRMIFKKWKFFSLKKSTIKRELFLSVADGDRDQIRLSGIDFAELLKKKPPEGLEVRYSFYENEDHGSIVHRSFYNSIENLFTDWRLTSKQIDSMSPGQVKEYYRNLSDKFGYKKVPTWAILTAAQQVTFAGKKEKSLDILEFILEQHPNDSEAHFLSGYFNDIEGELDIAREKLETAMSLIDENDSKYPLFKETYDSLIKRINEPKPPE